MPALEAPASIARRRLLAAGLLSMGGLPAAAQSWPAKPIRIVAAGPGGASADIVARLLADALSKPLGQPVIVEPKPGAAGVLAVNELLQSPHDGHTLLVGVNSLVSEIPHIVKMRVDMASAVVPLAELARGGLVLVAHPSFPAANLAELVAHAKSRPGTLHYASYSPGTLSHVLGLLLNEAAGIDLVHVGYKGSTPALTDVMGGHVPLMFDGIATSLPLLRAGRLKAYAVSTPRRSPLLPDVPTFAELGYPKLEALAWMGLWVPPDVPEAARQRLRAATLEALAQPKLAERLREIGFDAGQPRSIDEMRNGLRADYERVGATLKAIGFKPE